MSRRYKIDDQDVHTNLVRFRVDLDERGWSQEVSEELTDLAFRRMSARNVKIGGEWVVKRTQVLVEREGDEAVITIKCCIQII